MKPGDFVTQLGGKDLGEGAYITKIDNDVVYLSPVNSSDTIKIKLRSRKNEDDFHIPENSFYDPTALDSPELHDIRRLPMWWGPRDPNMPSMLTRVVWQPINYMNRNLQRRWGMRERKAFSRLLPRSVHLENWEEEDNHSLNTQELLALTEQIWDEYRHKQYTDLPERGKGDAPLYRFAIAFMRRHGLTPDDILLLFEFMVATGVIPYTEYEYVLDTLDSAIAYYLDK